MRRNCSYSYCNRNQWKCTWKAWSEAGISSDGMRFGTVGGAGLERKVETSLEELLSQKISQIKVRLSHLCYIKMGRIRNY